MEKITRKESVRQKSEFYSTLSSKINNNDINFRIPSDLRDMVYCQVIRRGDEEDWKFLYARYLKSEVAAEKTLMLSALGCSRQKNILTRILEWSISDDFGIRKQDAYSVFVSVLKNEVGFSLAMDFLEKKIEAVHEQYENLKLRGFIQGHRIALPRLIVLVIVLEMCILVP